VSPRLALVLVPALAVGIAAAPSFAAPKPKPITKSWAATANPDPSPNATGACTQDVPGGEHVEAFEVPAAGTLKVQLTGFQGDWDLCILDSKGAVVGSSTGFVEATTETVQLKLKKKTALQIVSQNSLGGPTASGTLTFTYK
jgi:hypothetical protein